MTVPTREEAASLLLSLDPPPWHVRHSRAVAEIAGWLALRIAQPPASGAHEPGTANPGRVNRQLVEAAALLHDVDKARPRALRGAGRHGDAGAAWLTAHGHPELGEVVALHPVTRLVDAEEAERVLRAPLEARILAYADKRAAQRLQPMAARFARWRRRHPADRPGGWSDATAEATWRRAVDLEREVCALARCRPEEVGRLRWTRRAIARAERAAAAPGG